MINRELIINGGDDDGRGNTVTIVLQSRSPKKGSRLFLSDPAMHPPNVRLSF